MGVSVGSSGGSGRRRGLDAEINLVPFIDLLSMCICFLLITAVWMPIATLGIKQSHGTEGAATTSKDLEMDLRFSSKSTLVLSLKQGGKKLKTFTVEAGPDGALPQRLDEALKAWRGSGGGEVASAMVTPKTGVPYGELVAVMDILRKNRIVNLGVVPVKET